MQRPGAVQLCSYAPDFSEPRWLGTLGNVAGLNYGDTMPGGNDTLQATIQMVRPGKPDSALKAGRILRAFQGTRWIWEGTLTAPVGVDQGWQITAAGAGHYGDTYAALDGSGFQHATTCIDAAISRGLRWINPGVSDTGMWLSQPPDNCSIYINDWLNQITSGGAFTWHIGPWNTLGVLPIPAQVTRLLVATAPASPTLNGYFNVLYTYYQALADTASSQALYLVGDTELGENQIEHGRFEAIWDLSSVGVMTGTDAETAAGDVLVRYNAASFSQPFTVAPGQYLTTGGQPVDLSTERAGEVVRLLLVDGGYGGQVTPSVSITFPVGAVQYDDDTQVLQVTPFQNVRNDLPSMLGALASLLQPPTTPGG